MIFGGLISELQKLEKVILKLPEIRDEILPPIIESNKKAIGRYVSENQLNKEGINGDGVKIASYRPYRPLTISIKKSKNQPTGRVTLKDTGAFHRSIVATTFSKILYFDSSDPKAQKLVLKYGESILDLTEANLDKVRREIIIYPFKIELRRRLKTWRQLV